MHLNNFLNDLRRLKYPKDKSFNEFTLTIMKLDLLYADLIILIYNESIKYYFYIRISN